MSEYLIHQRFFAKLKQKAENKRRELEESRRRGKENIEKEQLNVINQERLLRKRRSPAGNEASSSPAATQGEENMTSTDAEQQPSVTGDTSDDITAQASVGTAEASTENGNEQINHVCETAEVKRSAKEMLVEKKMRISNGFDDADIVQSVGEDDEGYQGMSLAKYLAETVQSQAEIMEVDVQEKDLEKERERLREEERERLKEEERERLREEERERLKEVERERLRKVEREKERIRQKEQEQKVASVSTPKPVSHKEPEHQHKSALTSVFHSLKDIFFGKSKKSNETPEAMRRSSGGSVEKEISHEITVPPSQTSPQEPETTTSVHAVASEQVLPKLVEEPSHVVNSEDKTETQEPSAFKENVKIHSAEHVSDPNVNKPEDASLGPERPRQCIHATPSMEPPEMPGKAEEENALEEVPQISHSPLFRVSS